MACPSRIKKAASGPFVFTTILLLFNLFIGFSFFHHMVYLIQLQLIFMFITTVWLAIYMLYAILILINDITIYKIYFYKLTCIYTLLRCVQIRAATCPKIWGALTCKWICCFLSTCLEAHGYNMIADHWSVLLVCEATASYQPWVELEWCEHIYIYLYFLKYLVCCKECVCVGC